MSGAEFARYATDLLRAAAGLDSMATRAVTRVGRGARATAVELAPVLTGALKAHVNLRVSGAVATVETDTYYAAFQEFGTSRMAPNPFIGPAVARWGPRLVVELEQGRDKALEGL